MSAHPKTGPKLVLLGEGMSAADRTPSYVTSPPPRRRSAAFPSVTEDVENVLHVLHVLLLLLAVR